MSKERFPPYRFCKNDVRQKRALSPTPQAFVTGKAKERIEISLVQ
ncbi:hypothetical protein BSU04_35445 [Caballeronia sordidicola]|uniref:Uncharacterized protein n=1 Tax=Caballeronia sordidicola TaxID=196367 RepID=A0A226WSJ4_CABSO|nr:hypothetical protein BSU04_35445 [Caballeronia sordidicola]